jgi:predicted phosphodiesterase
VLADVKDEVDHYICLGDIVNYGPNSNECIELISSLKSVDMILGNHEQYFLSPVRIQSEITLVKEFFCFCINDFKHFETLKLFKKTVEINDWTFKHTINNLKIYKNTEINITKNTSIGHSHQQYLRRINSKFLLNPGSVGQNRGNIKFANYAILNFDHGSFKLKSIEYEYQKFLKQIVSLNYSNNCKRYYTSKI